MATDSSVLPGPTTVNARAVLNRGHRESAAASNLNAACISAECSRLPAGAVVNAPLNASSALSLHVSPSESDRSLPSVPTVSCGLEYPPCLSSDVLRGDLSPLNTCVVTVYHQSVYHQCHITVQHSARAGGRYWVW